MTRYEQNYLLDTDQKVNPSNLSEHFLWKAWNQKVSVLVLKKTSSKPGNGYSLVLDHDDNGKEMLDVCFRVTADQSRRDLGYHQVVGVQNFDGERFGYVPNKKLVSKVQK